ncbi:Retrovirus-related Pol polyprotein, partial [Mucuna pruriens]
MTIIEIEPQEEWTLWFDGASNLLGNGIGAVLASSTNQCFPFSARLGFDYTNNMTEFEACTMGIAMALECQAKKLKVFGDSALVIYQLKGEWETRDAKLIPYQVHIKEMAKSFDSIIFHHIPREENQMADALATLAAMIQVNAGQEMYLGLDEAYLDEKSYGRITERKYENDKRTLRWLASGFFLNDKVLYKRSSNMTLLHCVNSQEAKEIIEEVHEGAFGTHAKEYSLARKILRASYYWTKMESDCYQHVKKCLKCQIYANNVHATPSPFSMWGLDVIGPLEPKASNGHKFILVAIDYFTKWVETTSYASVTKGVMAKFIKRDIICRYGTLAHIITDNGTNLNNKLVNELCEQFKVHHHNSTPYCPQMNEAIEAANKNIKKIVQKMVVTYKDWHDMLPHALHGYRTTIRMSNGATPYALV